MSYDPQQQSPYPPPPKQGMSTGKKIALGCGIPALLIAVTAVGCTALVGGAVHEAGKAVKANASEDARAAKRDVKITKCDLAAASVIGTLNSQVKITNHGKKRANYLVEGEVLDTNGNKVGELLASVSNLKPGTSTDQDFGGTFTSDDASADSVAGGSCSIVKVTRDEWSAAN